MILTENELFASFVLLSGSKIYFTDKVLLWVTQQLVTLDNINYTNVNSIKFYLTF